MKKYSFFILFAMSLFILSSCKKDNATNTQKLLLHFHNVSGNSALDYTSTFTTASGQRFQLSEFRYYLSGISLIKNDGSKYAILDTYLLVNPAMANYDMGKVPIGDYKGIEFNVGLDTTANHSDPTIYPATHPLAIQSPVIHWSWSSGYIFVKLEGMCDTTVGQTGALDKMLAYHLGLDRNLRTVTITKNFSVNANNEKTITIAADINKYLTGADFNTIHMMHSFDNATFATMLADNLQSMFSIQ